MKNLLSRIKAKTVVITALILGALTLVVLFVKKKTAHLASSTGIALGNSRGEGFVDTAIKILMAVVIGALVLAGLYALFGTTVLPELTRRIQEMFNFSG